MSMHFTRDRFIESVVLWTLSAIPFFFVFPLSVKAIPYAVLTIVAVYLLSTQTEARQTYLAIKPIALAFGLYLPYSLASIWLQGGVIKTGDNGTHFLLFLLIAICFREVRSQRIFWCGISAAAFAAGALALYQRFGLHIDRPYGMYGTTEAGFSGAIKFGMVTTVFSLLALVAALNKETPLKTRIWHACAALVGIAGCQVIGSRGPWLALMVFACFIIAGKVLRLNGKERWLAASFTLLCPILLAALFYPQLSSLVSLTSNELSGIEGGNFNTSMGHRMEMWKAALTMFIAHPFFGVGMNQYGVQLHKLIAAGQAPQFVAVFGHAHNEYLEALATGGITGLAYLLWLFGAPLAFFLRHFAVRRAAGMNAVVPLGGIVSALSFAFFAMGDNIFDRQMTTSLFAFLILGFAVMTICKEPAAKA